jgi:hypothetical protein
VSKKYKDKICVYCSARSECADHVVAREFFPETHRDGLPKVPACLACNQAKSDLERELTALLHFGSLHEAATTTLSKDGRRRLGRNPALRTRLQDGQRRITAIIEAEPTSVLALPFDGTQFVNLCTFIVRGLVWHQWHHVVPAAYVVEIIPVTDRGVDFFDHLLQMSPQLRGRKSFAKGAFEYAYTRNPQDPAFSVWRLQFYGSLNLAGVDQHGRALPVHMCALTGPAEVKELVEQFRAIGVGNQTAT